MSFWGGSGNDTFNFSGISGTGGTAYFWNEAGQDSIVLGNVVSNGAGAGVAFGVTSGASLNISFLKGQTSAAFGTGAAAGTITDLFSVASTKVSYGVSANGLITLSFHSGGGEIQIQGFTAARAHQITNAFNDAKAGTANFGTAFSIPTFS